MMPHEENERHVSSLRLLAREGRTILLILVLALLVYTALSFTFYHAYPRYPEVKAICDKVAEEFKKISKEVFESRYMWFEIFKRNLRAMIFMAIPLIGPVALFTSLTVTSMITGVAMFKAGSPLLISRVLLMPHTYLEMLAYAIAVTASIRFLKWLRLGRLRTYLISIVIGALILLIAAIVEEFLVKLLISFPLTLPL